MTVEENLLLGAYRPAARRELARNLAVCFETFPRLAERRRQLAGSMSGGEQQMLALGRALMLAPKILLVDEPSVGLAPILVSRTIDAINEMKQRYSLTVLMAEQNFNQAIRIADRGYVIVHGKIAFEGRSTDELNNNDLIKKFYLGLYISLHRKIEIGIRKRLAAQRKMPPFLVVAAKAAPPHCAGQQQAIGVLPPRYGRIGGP